MDHLVNLPNRVRERQRELQNSSRPVYYMLPRSKLYVNTWFAMFWVGLAGAAYGSWEMIKGKKKANE